MSNGLGKRSRRVGRKKKGVFTSVQWAHALGTTLVDNGSIRKPPTSKNGVSRVARRDTELSRGFVNEWNRLCWKGNRVKHEGVGGSRARGALLQRDRRKYQLACQTFLHPSGRASECARLSTVQNGTYNLIEIAIFRNRKSPSRTSSSVLRTNPPLNRALATKFPIGRSADHPPIDDCPLVSLIAIFIQKTSTLDGSLHRSLIVSKISKFVRIDLGFSMDLYQLQWNTNEANVGSEESLRTNAVKVRRNWILCVQVCIITICLCSKFPRNVLREQPVSLFMFD